MPVTEFALFRLPDSYDAVDLLEHVMEAQEVQDDWVRAHHPNECAKHASVSRMCIDAVDTPHKLLITAPWASPEAHHEWIATKENKDALARFTAFLRPGQDPDLSVAAEPDFVFFHAEAAGRRAVLHEAFAPKVKLTVTRLAAQGAAGREQLQNRYDELERELVEESPRDRIWAGWRIEKVGGQDELVVFHSDELPEEKLAPLKQYGKPIDRPLRIAEIAP